MLYALRILTVQDMLAFDLDTVKKLKGYGANFYKKLKKFKERVGVYAEEIFRQPQLDDETKDTIDKPELDFGDYYAREANPERLQRFPFFSDYQQELGFKMIHQSYQPDYPLCDLPLPARARTLFEEMGNLRIGDLLLLTQDGLIKNRKNIGRKSVYQVRLVIQEHIFFNANRDRIDPAQAESLRQMLESYIKGIVGEKESCVVISRHGLKEGQQKTLRQVADVLGVSRERVRKIEMKAMEELRLPHHLMRMEPVRKRLAEVLAEQGGQMAIGQLAEWLDREYQFTQPTETGAVTWLMSLFNSFIIEDDTVHLASL